MGDFVGFINIFNSKYSIGKTYTIKPVHLSNVKKTIQKLQNQKHDRRGREQFVRPVVVGSLLS